MASPRDADHALGLELQIEELVEQKTRAEVQGRAEDAEAIEPEISELQEELVETAERTPEDEEPVPTIHADHPGDGADRSDRPGESGGRP